jgi:hypothetical protein
MLRDSAGWRDTASLSPNPVDERRYHQSQNKSPKEALRHLGTYALRHRVRRYRRR